MDFEVEIRKKGGQPRLCVRLMGRKKRYNEKARTVHCKIEYHFFHKNECLPKAFTYPAEALPKENEAVNRCLPQPAVKNQRITWRMDW